METWSNIVTSPNTFIYRISHADLFFHSIRRRRMDRHHPLWWTPQAHHLETADAESPNSEIASQNFSSSVTKFSSEVQGPNSEVETKLKIRNQEINFYPTTITIFSSPECRFWKIGNREIKNWNPSQTIHFEVSLMADPWILYLEFNSDGSRRSLILIQWSSFFHF